MTTQDDLLDGLFQDAAARREPLPAALNARILADAEANQPRPSAAAPAARPRRALQRPGWIGAVADWFGGGLSLAGMTAAAGAGLYLGLAQPAVVLSLTESLTQPALERVDLMPDLTSLLAME